MACQCHVLALLFRRPQTFLLAGDVMTTQDIENSAASRRDARAATVAINRSPKSLEIGLRHCQALLEWGQPVLSRSRLALHRVT